MFDRLGWINFDRSMVRDLSPQLCIEVHLQICACVKSTWFCGRINVLRIVMEAVPKGEGSASVSPPSTPKGAEYLLITTKPTDVSTYRTVYD